MDNQRNLLPTHLDRFPPEMFGNTTFNLMEKAEELGVKDETSIKELNIKRYMRNLEILSEDGMKLSIMPIQTDEMVLTAIYQNINAFRFVKNQTPEICEVAVSIDPTLIEFVREQTDALVNYVLEQDPTLINKIKNPKMEFLEMVLDKSSLYIQYFKKEWCSEYIIKYAIDKYAKYMVENDTSLNCENIRGYTPLWCVEQTQETVNYATEKFSLMILDAKTDFITEEMVNKAIETAPLSVLWLDEKFWTKKLLLKALRLYIKNFKSVNLGIIGKISPLEWDEDLAIEILKLVRSTTDDYGSLPRDSWLRHIKTEELTENGEYIYIKPTPTFSVPTSKMLSIIKELDFSVVHTNMDLSFTEEGNIIAKWMLKYGASRYRSWYKHNKSFKRWLYNLGIKLRLV